MELITSIYYLILIEYTFFIALLIWGLSKVKAYEIENQPPITSFSIIIPFRNEAENLPDLLKSIAKLNYPRELFEIIAIDDGSIDDSVKIFNQWRIENGLIPTRLLTNLRLTNSPKKDAISRAIPIVHHQWIITTDADCIVLPNWLLGYDNYIQNHKVSMLSGAVCVLKQTNFLAKFQALDQLCLQATTIGSFGLGKPFMGSGANFAYKKSLFISLNGFEGNSEITSGDDVFLLQKAIQYNDDEVHFLNSKEVIVFTKHLKTILSLFKQRVRWASKTSNYYTIFPKALAVSVLMMNFSIVLLAILCCLGYFNWSFLFFTWLFKYFIDVLLINKSKGSFGIQKIIIPLGSALFYPFFTSIVGLFSIFRKKVSWK